MNILVVDDEAVMLNSIRIGLESSGHRVVDVPGGQQALNLLHQEGNRIDLLLTDYLMPEMNGIDLLQTVCKNHPTMPVMIMTAYAETRLVIEALNNRCASFIEKPFRLEQLLAEIERIKLYQSQRTRSNDLHQLLPRLVHQINNPLFSISGFAELLQMEPNNGDRVRKYAEKILDAVDQIGHINKKILDAGRIKP